MQNKLESISIVVAAKNEEKNIIPLLESLVSLNYPPDLFEIIIADDGSTDNTMTLAERFDAGLISLKVISAAGKELPGKKGALEVGINESKFPYILITDADCVPSENWLRIYSAKFGEGFDLLFGPAPFYQGNSLMNNIACFENLRSSLLYKAFAHVGLPYSAAARNMGFRKEAFYSVNGYRNTTETLSGDDDLLIREAFKNNLNIGYIDDKDCTVYSYAKESFSEYAAQKQRHTKTSMHYLPLHKLLLGGWHLVNLASLFSPLFIFKLMADVIIVKMYEKRFGYSFGILKTAGLQVIYELLLIYNFINALTGKEKWK